MAHVIIVDMRGHGGEIVAIDDANGELTVFETAEEARDSMTDHVLRYFTWWILDVETGDVRGFAD